MRETVKVLVAWTLSMAALFGPPAVTLAGPSPTPHVTFCGCTCWYSGAGGKTTSMGVTFTTDRNCSSIYNRETCYCNGQTCYPKYNAGASYKGELIDCKNTLPMKQAEPAVTVPSTGTGGVKPPGGPGQKQP